MKWYESRSMTVDAIVAFLFSLVIMCSIRIINGESVPDASVLYLVVLISLRIDSLKADVKRLLDFKERVYDLDPVLHDKICNDLAEGEVR